MSPFEKAHMTSY